MINLYMFRKEMEKMMKWETYIR